MELIDPGPIEFEAKIQGKRMRQNYAEWVGFPYDLKETYGKGNLVPMLVTFDGRVKYRGSLAKMGGPKAMILLRSDIKAELGKGAGDTVQVKIELDKTERKIELSADEISALKKAGLLEKFQKMAYSHQREYHQWIEEAKKPETRIRRLQKMVEDLAKK